MKQMNATKKAVVKDMGQTIVLRVVSGLIVALLLVFIGHVFGIAALGGAAVRAAGKGRK